MHVFFYSSSSSHLPPPTWRMIPPSRPGNDRIKAVAKVVPSPITIPLYFFYIYCFCCNVFYFFLSYSCFVIFTFLLLLFPLSSPLHEFCISESGGHCRLSTGSLFTSLLFDMDIVPKTDRKTQTRNSNKVKRSLLKIWSWLPRMRILNWNV